MSLFYDRDGQPIDEMRWAELFESRMRGSDYGRVAISKGYGYTISTDWLGADHSFGSGPPLIFETMIFVTDSEYPHVWLDYQERYSTEEQALEGHRRAAEWLKLRVTGELTPKVIRGELEP